MRFPLLALLFALPIVAAGPLAEPAGDEFLALPPSLARADPPALAPPGLCHAPAVDLLAFDVAGSGGSLSVSLSAADLASRAFSCTDLAEGIGRPSYTVAFYASRWAYAGVDAPKLLLTSSSQPLRCWGYVPGFFYPVACDLTVEGNTLTWTIAATSVPSMPPTAYAVARAEAAAGDLWIQDLAD